MNKCVIDLFDLGEVEFMMGSFKSNDVFIIISLSGETKEGIESQKESTKLYSLFLSQDYAITQLHRFVNTTYMFQRRR